MAVQSKARAKEILQGFVDSIPALHELPADSQEFANWHRDTEIGLEYIFGGFSRQVNEFARIVSIPMDIIFTGNNYSEYGDAYVAYVSCLDNAGSMLQSMIDEIEKYWPDDNQPQIPAAIPETQKRINTSQVFIIHGRDIGTRELVARFLESLGLEPVILQEQPDRNRAIIEKFEEYAQVNFAIALFTPDDFGGLEGDDPQFRARQNVIFEFGYFIGKYGRDRVRALVKGDVEIPSDYSGVIYIPLGSSGSWKIDLVRELKSAGFNVDANRLFE